MTEDRARGADVASVKAFPPVQEERGTWHTITRVEKYNNGVVEGEPDEVIEKEGNLLCNAGIQVMLNRLAKNTGTVYSTSANAYVSAGSGVTPAAAANTVMETPLQDRHQATAIVTNQSVAFSANFASGHASGAWEEVGVFNHVTAGAMLNHVVSPLGTKAAGAAWVLTITITIS